MQKGRLLNFACTQCKHSISFSIFDLKGDAPTLTCEQCGKRYSFSDETLLRQLKKFETLCKTLCDSEEILSNASVGVDVGERKVQIPFKLLLTRLNSRLDLKVGDEPLSIQFRIEPIRDVQQKERL